MSEKITQKDKESPFGFIPDDPKKCPNIQVTKDLLEASSDNFTMFNYAALDSDNLKNVEEALKKKDMELKQMIDESHLTSEMPKIYDDLFNTPK